MLPQAQGKDGLKEHLGLRIVDGAFTKSILNVRVVNMYNDTSRASPERREVAKSFKNGKNFQEVEVLLSVLVRELLGEGSRWGVHAAPMAADAVLRGIGPDMFDDKWRGLEEGDTIPRLQRVDPP
ncbi:uncharacterized protein UBRO_20351 [Ustilago bromivora]|uniref:Uncharacterized protein n=1 Tax=Ustilago bromivora TaxID=307758 RepID=A0A1K0HE25_9BASI|nr:uncharacterized protein UBRO_20351 [Ustilago bromivora]SYW79032.1 uncharacterized protein UBRO2_02716 [Ustilago bromivora]